ncbi:MAG: hypothetical protein COZ06_04600 [Armatimonadetes bacterium CG_4_10_14_3_um_filter_66_18]|nr:MAG: hypothetical protein COZ57_12295 [Armatimonadetes bacterium CG_4_8_14_3_um_filter_66_20]PIY51514.1 MAG: hypothetical protein COZ06_04600 [Armatimonadetes bacterium CG_4_10_14_3_um_filter_66_18]
MPDTPTAPQRLPVGALVTHPSFGSGQIVGHDPDKYVILFKSHGTKFIAYSYDGLVVEGRLAAAELEPDRIKAALREVLGEYGWIETDREMDQRWAGGTLVLRPGREGTQEKEIPLEVFFKKIIGVREKLRVLEQRLNNHPSLSPEDKLEFEGYLTRCYGSLTTFNVLFADKERQFRGQSG